MAVDLGFTNIYQGGSGAAEATSAAFKTATGWVDPNTYYNYRGGDGWKNTGSTNGIFGARLDIGGSGGVDMSADDYITFVMTYERFGVLTKLDTLANGGIRVGFEDTSGNFVVFYVHGDDLSTNNNRTAGGFEHARSAGTDGSWCGLIERTRTPDQSSGTIDWTSIRYFLSAMKIDGFDQSGLTAGGFATMHQPILTGSNVAFTELEDGYDGASDTYRRQKWWSSSSLDQAGGSTQFAAFTGLDIGDGSTTTTATIDGTTLGFYPSVDQTPPFGMVALDDTTPNRLLRINQSASDNIAFTNCQFRTSTVGSASWGLEVTGSSSGDFSFTNGVIGEYYSCVLGHGSYTNTTFENGDAAIDIGAGATVSGCTVRNSQSGIRITGAAGDYSALTINLSGNTTYDVIVGSGGAGTYDLTGLSVPSGYTLKVRNESAVNAVTVTLTPGIATSASTAGGSLTIDNSVSVSLQLTGLVANSEVRVYRSSDDVELAGVENSGTSFTYNYVHSADVDVYIVVASLDYLIERFDPVTLTASGVSIPVQQTLDRVYSNP